MSLKLISKLNRKERVKGVFESDLQDFIPKFLNNFSAKQFCLKEIHCLKNTVISTHFPMSKFCGKAQFPNRPKLCGNSAFSAKFPHQKITRYFTQCFYLTPDVYGLSGNLFCYFLYGIICQ